MLSLTSLSDMPHILHYSWIPSKAVFLTNPFLQKNYLYWWLGIWASYAIAKLLSDEAFQLIWFTSSLPEIPGQLLAYTFSYSGKSKLLNFPAWDETLLLHWIDICPLIKNYLIRRFVSLFSIKKDASNCYQWYQWLLLSAIPIVASMMTFRLLYSFVPYIKSLLSSPKIIVRTASWISFGSEALSSIICL